MTAGQIMIHNATGASYLYVLYFGLLLMLLFKVLVYGGKIVNILFGRYVIFTA